MRINVFCLYYHAISVLAGIIFVGQRMKEILVVTNVIRDLLSN